VSKINGFVSPVPSFVIFGVAIEIYAAIEGVGDDPLQLLDWVRYFCL